ncbi:MAG TPA: class I SAM-dependent methyltransferase [Acidimicrobiales bacterium]|jgi:ubiquinone/menaquinone biosynthesis C-methylase UbiE
MTTITPNHHAHQPGFAGVSGLLAGLTMTVGRGAVARLAADEAEVGRDDRVVDVGCGPGTAAREAARRGAQVTGVDPAPVMLSLARRLTRSGPSVSWVEGTAEALPLLDGTATVLWSISTVHHWVDVDAGLAEVFRVLASGGRLLAIERHSQPGAKGLASHGWTDDQAAAFADLCRSVGFSDVGVASHRAGRKTVLVVRAAKP